MEMEYCQTVCFRSFSFVLIFILVLLLYVCGSEKSDEMLLFNLI